MCGHCGRHRLLLMSDDRAMICRHFCFIGSLASSYATFTSTPGDLFSVWRGVVRTKISCITACRGVTDFTVANLHACELSWSF